MLLLSSAFGARTLGLPPRIIGALITLLAALAAVVSLEAVGVILVVAMMVIPLPPFLIDLFITLNISAALMIVVATLYVPRALDFSSFPTILLLTTLFRLAINAAQLPWLGTMSDRVASAARAAPWPAVLLAPVAGGLIVGLLLTFVSSRRAGGPADVMT